MLLPSYSTTETLSTYFHSGLDTFSPAAMLHIPQRGRLYIMTDNNHYYHFLSTYYVPDPGPLNRFLNSFFCL